MMRILWINLQGMLECNETYRPGAGHTGKRLIVSLTLIVLGIALLSSAPGASAQGGRSRGVPMYYLVENGDTTYIDTIEPVWCIAKGRGGMKKGDWRKYYKLVYDFNKVYPYALVGRKMMAQVDSTIAVDVSKRSQRNKYINDVEKELLRLFEKDIRHMSIRQGVLLLRLVDRECGMSAFNIIKTYENGFAANFWQLVAKLFSQDLKSRYDPTGVDAKTEELCEIWDSGKWDSFYYSIFMERPARTQIVTDKLSSSVKKK